MRSICCAALFLLSGGAALGEELRRDTTGFQPLWENTGYVEESGEVRLGTTGAQVGLAGRAHAGVQPLNFAYRSPNAYLKLALPGSARWHLAVQAGAYRLLEGASRSSFSPMYSSRIDNPDFAVTLLPASFSASVLLFPWLELHQTLTGLGILAAGPLKGGVTPGYAAVAELNPRGRHSLSLHAEDAGLWTRDLAAAGASYRYRNGWMEFRLGYFYRFTRAGRQAAPLAALAVLL